MKIVDVQAIEAGGFGYDLSLAFSKDEEPNWSYLCMTTEDGSLIYLQQQGLRRKFISDSNGGGGLSLEGYLTNGDKFVVKRGWSSRCSVINKLFNVKLIEYLDHSGIYYGDNDSRCHTMGGVCIDSVVDFINNNDIDDIHILCVEPLNWNSDVFGDYSEIQYKVIKGDDLSLLDGYKVVKTLC